MTASFYIYIYNFARSSNEEAWNLNRKKNQVDHVSLVYFYLIGSGLCQGFLSHFLCLLSPHSEILPYLREIANNTFIWYYEIRYIFYFEKYT